MRHLISQPMLRVVLVGGRGNQLFLGAGEEVFWGALIQLKFKRGGSLSAPPNMAAPGMICSMCIEHESVYDHEHEPDNEQVQEKSRKRRRSSSRSRR